MENESMRTESATTNVQEIPPTNGGTAPQTKSAQPFAAMPAPGVIDPKSPQSIKLQQWHDLAAEVTKDDLEIEKIKNDL
jgi:hypothetical protein